MKHFFASWFGLTIAAAIMIWLLPGMTAVGNEALAIIGFALFMALINASIKPFVKLLTLPITILTIGIFGLILNILFIELASWLSVSIIGVGIHIDGFWWALIGSLILTFISSIVENILKD
jgi:putative membrane protein